VSARRRTPPFAVAPTVAISIRLDQSRFPSIFNIALIPEF
jgi:hypothetical protein